ncbi:hypothetical protein K0M31_009684 [Melipona bicolor]|uniref:Uncharacterized protein n=1 Tax=Melipona bicolor TaxID=60889 RepID=A0AA40KJ98_9HYME|nr:hypothetical protein K0M31_009684 [Melipona bicolor]
MQAEREEILSRERGGWQAPVRDAAGLLAMQKCTAAALPVLSLKRALDRLSGRGHGTMNRPVEEGTEVVREMVAESVAAMVMAMDDTRLGGTRWWKRRCRHGSRETGSNWHKPATGRVDNDAPCERESESERERDREREPERRQINSERYTIHASPRSRFGSPFLSGQPLSAFG